MAKRQLPVIGTYAATITTLILALFGLSGCGGGTNASGGTTSTTTTLTASAATVASGASVTLTAAISPTDATGTVTFYDGTSSLGTATISSGTASLATSALSVGTHTLTAAYGGSAVYASSTASTVTVTVTAAASTAIDTSTYAVSVAATASTYSAADLVTNTTFDTTVIIDFTANTARLSSGTAQAITTDGVTLLSSGGTSIAVTKTTYGITISSTVATNVMYVLSGQLNGTLTVSSSSAYQLYLNGVAIAGTAGPALDLESTQKVFIVSAAGTTNTLADSATRSMTMKAALYGKGPMVFGGSGILGVTGSYKHGIFSNDYVRVCSGTLTVAVSAKDAIRSVNGFIFDDGILTVSATGTTTGDESKGIKVEGSESTGAGKGYVVINGGYLTVTSVGKGISAGWDIDEDATTTDTSDDPSPYVEINNGVITVTTTGTPYEYTSGGTTVSCSPEGIEGKTNLTVNNGYLTISTTDDALNAGKAIVINGGYLYCASSANDAIDSNGTLTITGGVIVAIGSSAPEAAFDCDQNTFTITGGTFVGIGGTTSTPTASTSKQYSVILGSGTKGTTMALKAADGTVVFAFTIPQSYETMLLSSPNITAGTTYTRYTGGTASAGTVFNGLYVNSLSYSGGTAGKSFTVSSYVTNAGS
ncbi:carbohydrate-binding domain-containing protein [Geobacter sp. FeAm09]|uniref:carbohydrate-binding domain-containing protein n=1 Tax=Geobacter sp. FeAm09 TaxID=2597769 RepID=UPI0011EE883E|nr:carbohydrate-binding domain-containing protein [Geobacter sp. FeAm09]QEM67418.1 carbohydrate-binding domain-containing protein [Geobacter sp. FeAm09]